MAYRFKKDELELDTENPYGGGRVTLLKDGTAEIHRELLKGNTSLKDEWHTVRHGETLEGIAFSRYRKYESEEKAGMWYWLIADANEEIIENPLDLSGIVGSEIRIPYLPPLKLAKQSLNE